MANIPQDLPNQEAKSFLGYSKPIEQPQPDRTLETLFKGIGSTLEGVAKGGDAIFKEIIKSGLREDVDRERQNFSDELTQYNEDVKVGTQRTANATNPLNTFAQATAEDIPDELTDFPGQVSNLVAARGAGKVSPTQYWLAIDNIAKDYRSRYPGHRDYIDAQISSITGHNPANAYMTSIMQDLNRNLIAGAKVDPLTRSATTAVIEMAKKGGIPKGEEGVWLSTAQTDPAKAIAMVNNAMGPHWKSEATNWELSARKGNLENASITAQQVVPQTVANMVFSDFNGQLIFADETVQSIQKKAFEAAANPDSANPKDMQMLGVKMMALRQMSEQKTRKWLLEPIGPNGESRAMIAAGIGKDPGKYTNDLIQEHYKIFDNMITNIAGKNPTLAALQAEYMQAQSTNDRYNALKTDFGNHLRMMEVLKNDPKALQEYMKVVIGNNKDYGSPNINVFAKDMLASFMTGRSQGKVVSINDAIEKAKAAGVQDPRLYKDFAEFGTQILNPNLPHEQKVNIAASMFNPTNYKFLSQFNEDQRVVDRDGQTRAVPGKYAIWAQYTNPAFASEIKKIGEKNPEVKQWYKAWIEQGFGSDIYGPQVRELSTKAADPRVTFTYNNVDNQFNAPSMREESFFEKFAASTQRRAGVLDDAGDYVYKINQGINGLKAAAQAQGITDPSRIQSYVMGQLKALGYVEPQPRVVPNPQTMKDAINNAFISAAKAFNPLAGPENPKPKSQDRMKSGK